jgi:hypothetical protein
LRKATALNYFSETVTPQGMQNRMFAKIAGDLNN